MQKKLLAVAVAGALGAPALALAQASTVSISGTIYQEYSWVKQGLKRADGSNFVKGDQIQTPGSEILVKGEESLGGGMSAWFQCASTFDLRGQGGSGGPGAQGFCGRNSAIGLKGGWGNFFVGNWDTPFKRTQGANRIVNETGAFGAAFLLYNASASFDGRSNNSAWLRRQNNSIAYDTPVWNGLQLMLQTTTTGSSVNTSTNGGLGATTAVPGGKPRLYSAAATYNNGPLSLAGAYEQHRNYMPGLAAATFAVPGAYSGHDTGWHVNGSYVIGPVKVGAVWTHQKYDTGLGTELKHTAWNLAADWKVYGPHGLRLGYTRAEKNKGNFAGSVGNYVGNAGVGGTGAHMWQLVYINTLSKRTELAAGYVRLTNNSNATYTLGGSANTPLPGEDQNAGVVYIKHTF